MSLFNVQLSGCGTDNDIISGGNGEGVPPVPIPNTEVKPFSADGTWLVTARESRSPPDSTNKPLAFSRWSDHRQTSRNRGLFFYPKGEKGVNVEYIIHRSVENKGW